MDGFVSVIIPNYNGSATIGKCLEAAFSSKYRKFEVVVVDDCSTDKSIDIIKQYPCRLVQLDKHSGTSRARNVGARNSKGEILFFIDADCLLQDNALSVAIKSISGRDDMVIGGTYTKIPYDNNFFSTFQSIFINYFETKKKEPDYIATHAMVIDTGCFHKSGGFSEDFLPILEDVEFSHRLRRSSYKLIMNPDLLVRHIFNFTLVKSLMNAFNKSKFWTIYSLKNRDLLSDSGTASVELKTNGASFFINSISTSLFLSSGKEGFLFVVPLTFIINVLTNRGLMMAFYRTKGLLFAIAATTYYMMLYPIAVVAGFLAGVLRYLLHGEKK